MTPNQIRALRLMAEHRNDDDGEIVCEGRQCWLGDEPVSRFTVTRLLQLMAIKDVSLSERTERYIINETGEALNRRPALSAEIRATIARGRPFRLVDDRIALLEDRP